MDPQRFLTGLGLISVSMAVHGSVFFTMDRAVSLYQVQVANEQRKIEREKNGPIQFEFVEAPRAISFQKHVRSKRISSRHSLNQDLLKDKTAAAIASRTELQGRANQLAQEQGQGSQAAVPQFKPSHDAEERQTSQKPHDQKINERGTAVAKTEERFIAERSSEATGEVSRASVKPKPEVRGQGGPDRITTQEMSKIKSPGARLFGQTSFEATGSGMGEYMKNLKEKIWLAWFPYLAFQYPQDFRGADVVVDIILDAKGDVKIVQLVDSVGSPVFASYCMEAIQRASGFGPVPREILELIGKDELEIKFGFHYR